MAIDKKQLKDLVLTILKKNEKSYDDWLIQKHTELILENALMLQEGIEEKKETKNDSVSNKQEIGNNRPWEQSK